MSRNRAALRVLAAAAILAVVPVAPSGAAHVTTAQAKVQVTATPSATSATPGEAVTVTGTARPGAKVVLQRLVASRWGTVQTATTDATGTYTLPVPTDWYLRHRLRVKDTATDQASPAFTVDVHPDYEPEGRATAWTRMFERGVRWDSCRVVPWGLNPKGAHGFKTADQVEALKGTFTTLTLLTGIEFKYVGTSNAAAFKGRHIDKVNILIDWQTPAQTKGLRGGVVGLARPYATREFKPRGATREIAAGDVAIDATALPRGGDIYDDGYQEALLAGVALHELGHVMGLDHSEDPHQLMHYSRTEWNWRPNAGDLAGFARLGAQNGCMKHPFWPAALAAISKRPSARPATAVAPVRAVAR